MFMVLMSETQKSTNEKLSCYTDKILQLIAQ